MALPPKLELDLVDLRKVYTIEVVEDPTVVNIVFKEFPLGDGFNVVSSDLLLRVPRTYPDAGPDMFWVNQTVALANGTAPQAADSIEEYIGRRWRRFSWHWQGSWKPTIDNLHGYIEFVRRRLREKR